MKKLIILLSIIFCHQIHARWFADIHAGFGFTPETSQQPDTLVFEGVETGARFGLGYKILIFGVDASYGWLNSQFQYLSPTDYYDMQKLDLGVFLGFEIIKLVRIWGSYFPYSEMNFDASGSPKLQGTVAGGGVGLTILPYVTFNGEIKFYNMNKYMVSGSTITMTGSQKIDPFEIIFSLGLVF